MSVFRISHKKMKLPIFLTAIILIGIYSCTQTKTAEERADFINNKKCKCIDNFFSSSLYAPFVYSKIGEYTVAFCGLIGKDYDLDSLARKANNNAGFKRTGYEIILCSKDSSIYVVGEYYLDSIQLFDNHFELFRLSDFPVDSTMEYQNIPLLEFHFTESNGKLKIDTTIAIPPKFTTDSYLEQIKKLVEENKADSLKTTKYHDLKLHYLFLKAVSNDAFKEEFKSSGPYDGYMGPIFRDFKSYLDLEKNKNGE